MIDSVQVWFRNIIFFLVFSAFLEVIMPINALKKYISLIIGLVFLVVVTQPILNTLGLQSRLNMEVYKQQYLIESKGIENMGKHQKNIQSGKINENYKDIVEQQLIAIVGERGYSIHSLSISYDQGVAGKINSIEVYLQKEKVANKHKSIVQKINIESVHIKEVKIPKIKNEENKQLDETVQDNTEVDKRCQEIQALICGFFSLEKEQVNVLFESE